MFSLLLIATALAHPGADERLRPEGCDDIVQMFRRSAALSAESRLDEAEAQIRDAARCGADPAETSRALAELAVSAGRPEYALSLLEQIASAEHAAVHIVRSDALAAQGRPSEAADSRLLAIAQLSYVTPDLTLTTAHLLEAAGRVDEALARVDEGHRRTSAASLQVEGIRLAARLDPERALDRLDRLPPTAAWMQKRGEILTDLGRTDEARTALTEALSLAESARSSRKQREQIATLTLAIESLNP